MTTIKKDIHLSGRGIHSGLPVNIIIHPSRKRGIYFIRSDMADAVPMIARWDNVGETKMRNTTIGTKDGAHVQTVEHLMAALFINSIDSAIIEIDGAETPILDGSAAVFMDSLMSVVDKKTPMRKIIVKQTVVASANEILRTLPRFTQFKLWVMNKLSGRKSDGFVKLTPANNNGLNIRATLVYPEKIIGNQTFEYTFDGSDDCVQTFISDVARARTFGKYSEWEYLKKHGMGRGADATNVIALNDAGDGTLNKLIWDNEFVRHKIIDVLGDMFTSGGFVIGNLESYKGSHAMNNLVLKKLFSNPANYDIIEQD